MYQIEGKSIQAHLLALAERGNKPFSTTLHPGIEHVLGIRVPDLRQLARKIVAHDWQTYLQEETTYFYMEERMLRGMVIGCIPVQDTSAYLEIVDTFVPIINSWSVCDTFDFSGKQRFVDKNKAKVWAFLQKWIQSDKEYEIRFGVVMMMAHFLTDAYIDDVLNTYQQITHTGYYVRMAIAWALSVCYVKYPAKTLGKLQAHSFEEWTHNKALQKIQESRRVSETDKQALKRLKR